MSAKIELRPQCAGFPDLGAHHRGLVADRARVRAFRRAIARIVKPGDVVVDLGTGTGILALLAARAGASRVYAIEKRPVIAVARENARRNGLEERIAFVEGDAREVALPDRADVLLSDAMGVMGVGGTMLAAFQHVRERTRPARVIPASLRLRAAPVESAAFTRHVHFWARPRSGLDLGGGHALAVNNLYNVACPEDALLAPPREIASRLLLGDDLTSPIDARARFTATRDATLDGWCGWFDADMAPGVRLTCAPGAPATVWRQVFFPLARPTPVKAGDALTFTLATAPADRWPHVTDFDWTTTTPTARQAQSTRDSFP